MAGVSIDALQSEFECFSVKIDDLVRISTSLMFWTRELFSTDIFSHSCIVHSFNNPLIFASRAVRVDVGLSNWTSFHSFIHLSDWTSSDWVVRQVFSLCRGSLGSMDGLCVRQETAAHWPDDSRRTFRPLWSLFGAIEKSRLHAEGQQKGNRLDY